jgi:rod shape-determining protein MreC
MHDQRRTRPVLIALLIVAVALITIDFRDGGNSSAHSLGGRILGPFERLGGDATGWFGGGGGAEITALQRRNDELLAELASSQTAGADAAALAGLLHLSLRRGYRVVAATVIAAGGDYSDTVTIDAGSGDGIAPNETVLNGDGLVGTVTGVTGSTATVQLATDAGATVGIKTVGTKTVGTKTVGTKTVGIKTVGSGQIGALSGTADSMTGTAPLKLTMFGATATLKPGEQVVTFGSVGGRPYVPGVPVGTVTTVTTKPGSLTPTALVRPFADFTGLGVVGVVVSK